MKNQSNHLAHGEHREQWYKLDPDRYKEELSLLKEHYPDFKQVEKDDGNICWVGVAKFYKSNNEVLKELEIEIVCLRDYPITFPRVYDLSGTLDPSNCPHLTNAGNGKYILCYGNRLDPELNFEEKTRVKDVIDYVSIFLAYQWHHEKKGNWPSGQPHGTLPFLEHEINGNTIQDSSICPCGLHDKPYYTCHKPELSALLSKLDSGTTLKVCKDARKVSRNEPCPCGSDVKYKKCCLNKINFPNSKTYLLLRFPDYFGISIQKRNRFMKALVTTADEIHSKNQKSL